MQVNDDFFCKINFGMHFRVPLESSRNEFPANESAIYNWGSMLHAIMLGLYKLLCLQAVLC